MAELDEDVVVGSFRPGVARDGFIPYVVFVHLPLVALVLDWNSETRACELVEPGL